MKAQLLEVFMRHPGEVLSREYLDEACVAAPIIWATRAPSKCTSAGCVKSSRRTPIIPCYLQTIRGVGYRFSVEPES